MVCTPVRTTQQTLQIDREQAIAHLKALGYKNDETVFLRSFPPKGQQGHPRNSQCQFPNLPLQQTSQGGLYFVVNGDGQRDEKVQRGRAIFVEFDDRPVEDQLLFWQSLGLPEPTIQVTTRKSIHSYWALDDPCSVAEWKQLQSDLLEFVDGDRTLKNPSRVMRLAGSWHIKGDAEPIKCDIVSHADSRYSYRELRQLIPQQQPRKRVEAPKKQQAGSGSGQNQSLSDLLRKQVYPRLTPEEVYSWGGHDWQPDRSGNKLRGCCPWHDSQSGTAFYTDYKDGVWLWRCPSCDIGGDPIQYRWLLKGGSGTPTGKNFVEILQELCEEAGVAMPNYSVNNGTYEQVASLQGSSPPGKRSKKNKNSLAENYYKIESAVGSRIKLNLLSQEIEFNGKPVLLEELRLTLALDYNISCGRQDFFDVATALAKKNQYSPVIQYLQKVHARYSEQGSNILNTAAARFLGAADNISKVYLRKWFISAVARAMDPGCQVDTCLFLQGCQGYGKSSFFQALMPQRDWFGDSMGDVGHKDEVLKLHLAWVNEWAELENIFGKRESSQIKAFLTSRVDALRPPYGRSTQKFARRSVIVGTTNQDDFLNDASGSRRFWVVRVNRPIDLKKVSELRDRLWAAAVDAYLAGEQWWLTAEEQALSDEQNKEFTFAHPWLATISDYVGSLSEVTSSEVLDQIKPEIGQQSKRDSMAVADCLKHLGWKQAGRSKVGHKLSRKWINPACYQSAPPEDDPTSSPPYQPDPTSPSGGWSHSNDATASTSDEPTNLTNLYNQETFFQDLTVPSSPGDGSGEKQKSDSQDGYREKVGRGWQVGSALTTQGFECDQPLTNPPPREVGSPPKGLQIKVGDRVRYVGSALAQIMAGRLLTVVSITEDQAKVQAAGWAVTHWVSIRDLRLAPAPQPPLEEDF